ncbi:hypothetical protein [uncultured Desulfobacter sp.]|uniref:hypothetical protein n=1 Tax=uncultured Desulfobacter sp. TaxID=240139 RepID=UPI002AABFD5A|nr:hypothetical protein [uncultured Desulfobacter sp.]
MNRQVHLSDPSPDIIEKNSFLTPAPSDQNAWAALDSARDLFFKSLAFGRVRGVVDIIVPPDSEQKDDLAYSQLIHELLQHDILVTISGRGTEKTDPVGMIPAPDLFQSAENGLSEFCDFIGVQPVLHIGRIDDAEVVDFYNEIAQRAGVNIGDLPVATISPDQYLGETQNFGNIFTMDKGPGMTADLINARIHEQRLALKWCDRCGGAFSAFS